MPYIPAATGTCILTLDGPSIPVVGWSITEGGQVAFPVVLTTSFNGFRSGMAYSIPDQLIFDPVWNRHFATEEDWREGVAEHQPYIPGKVPGVSGKDEKAPPTMTQRTSAAAPAKSNPPKDDGPKPNGRPPKELATAPVGLVVMGTKTFKGKSFWRYTDDINDFVFTVEGGLALPNDSCATKITRDDYFAVRKTIPEMQLPAPGAANPDEPELPMGDPEEDDGMDMI